MQNFRNYYQILDISKDASVDEIKKAYRKLARQFHPDVNPGSKEAEEKFKDINEAYDILSDVEKRLEYDKFIRYWKPKGIASRMGMRVPDFRNWGDNLSGNGVNLRRLRSLKADVSSLRVRCSAQSTTPQYFNVNLMY